MSDTKKIVLGTFDEYVEARRVEEALKKEVRRNLYDHAFLKAVEGLREVVHANNIAVAVSCCENPLAFRVEAEARGVHRPVSPLNYTIDLRDGAAGLALLDVRIARWAADVRGEGK